MSIRSVYRSKAVVAFSILFFLTIVTITVIRSGVTEAQERERAATNALQAARGTVVVDGHYQVNGQPATVYYGQRPYTQASPGPNMSPETASGFSFGFNLPVSTAAPMSEGDRRAAELANQIRQTQDKNERESLRGELREVLSMAFDQRREQQLQEIQQLQQQLAAIRELDEKRQQRKDEIVQRRISELLSEPDALDWEPKRFQGQFGFPSAASAPSSLPAMPNGVWLPARPNGPPARLQARTSTQTETLRSPETAPRTAIIVSKDTRVDLQGVTDGNAMRVYGDRIEKVEDTTDFTIPSDAKDAFIYKMTESILENVEQFRRVRESSKRDAELSDQQKEQLSASEARIRSSIENGRSVWRMIGKRKEHDLEAAERALELAKRRLEIIGASYKQGVVPEIELLNETAAVQKASSGVDREKDQLAVWKELDKQLHEALEGVGLLDTATDKVEESEAVKDVEPTVEDGAQRHDLFYQIRISYSVSVWWKPVA